jgi:hypothetical protein
MDRCPNCGWEIQFGTTCYNCVGREQDAKRHGGKPINPNWRRKYRSSNTLKSNEKSKRVKKRKKEPTGPKMGVSVNRRSQRMGINRFLHDVYGKNYLLSDILRKRGFTKNQIQALKRQTLEPFIDDVVEGWIYILKKQLSWQLAETVRFYYELEGSGQSTIKLYEWSDSQEKRYLSEGVKTLGLPSIRTKLENKVISAAKKNLKSQRRK